jgi:hypothetical protein
MADREPPDAVLVISPPHIGIAESAGEWRILPRCPLSRLHEHHDHRHHLAHVHRVHREVHRMLTRNLMQALLLGSGPVEPSCGGGHESSSTSSARSSQRLPTTAQSSDTSRSSKSAGTQRPRRGHAQQTNGSELGAELRRRIGVPHPVGSTWLVRLRDEPRGASGSTRTTGPVLASTAPWQHSCGAP